MTFMTFSLGYRILASRQRYRTGGFAVPVFRSRRTQNGFTLVELLVVIAIIGVLVALLLPAVQSAREASRRMQCSNNLKQVGLALHSFHDSHGFLPPGGVTAAEPKLQIPSGVNHGWAVFLLPYVEQKTLYDRYRLDKDWRGPENKEVRETYPKVFLCPSSPVQKRTDAATSGGFTWTSAAGDYFVNNAVSTALSTANLVDIYSGGQELGVMRVNGYHRFAEITDGLSNTSWIQEDAGRPTQFRAGKRIGGRFSGAGWADRDNEGILHGMNAAGTSSPGPCAVNCSNDNEIYAFHPNGAMILLGDGAVRFLSQNTDIRIVARLITRGAGETVTDF
jgi:prepilin-type N-terminal cleavage/methylation domain-containing protein